MGDFALKRQGLYKKVSSPLLTSGCILEEAHGIIYLRVGIITGLG